MMSSYDFVDDPVDMTPKSGSAYLALVALTLEGNVSKFTLQVITLNTWNSLKLTLTARAINFNCPKLFWLMVRSLLEI